MASTHPHTRPPALRRLAAEESGWGLVESLTAMLLLVVGVFGLMTMLDTSNQVTNANLRRDSGTSLAREVVERARQLPYTTLATPLPAATALAQAIPGAGSASNGVWTTNRRGVTYTTTLNTCVVDDPSDGLGGVSGVPCKPANGSGGPGTGANGGPPLTVSLNVLGIPVNAAVGGVLDQVCAALGQSALVDGLLKGNGVVDGLLGLVDGGADIGVCSSSGSTTVGYDRKPQDLTRVTATVTWAGPRPGRVTQSTLVPQPGGGG